jgi:rsbT co-antagonist protein RsbR
MQEMNITESEILRRLRIVHFTPEDLRRVLAIKSLILERADAYTESFFAYLSSQEEAAELVSDGTTMEFARRLKNEHLKAIASGQYGAPYVEERLKLGRLYASAGLDPRVFLGAYHHLMSTIGFDVMEKFKRRAAEAFANFLSLQKLAFFDLSLIVDVIVFERERVIRTQQKAIRELSTPVLKVRERLLVLPIIGIIDSQRAKQMTQDLLNAIHTHRARAVVVDITGVPEVDLSVANHLVQTVQAARLIGATCIVTGLSADVAHTLVSLGVDISMLKTIGGLQGGVEEAERLLDRVVMA